MNLTPQQKALHEKALHRCRDYKSAEWAFIQILQDVESTKLFKTLDCSDLYAYAMKFMGLDESVAYTLVQAARIAREIPRPAESLRDQKLSVSKAARIFSTLKTDNASQLISFAETHTTSAINREVARVREQAGLPARMRNLKVSDNTLAKAKRLRSVLKEKDLDTVIHRALEESLERHDPVRKADRAMKRKADADQGPAAARKTPPESDKVATVGTDKRKPLTAEQKHEVFARDQGRCTHIDQHGRRCENDRWLQIHHIRPVSLGGGNEPANLTTLCSFHHDQAHQLTFPIEGQITWVRDRVVTYGSQ